ncbi:junctophilin-1-like [Ornithodoros turicata]|uniref:junctophilin-1-like n=1 Tax=Ornithodoros turicata TaxID=34597 RepID=UPI0031388123
MSGGGRFDFDDGGTYCGGWEDGKAHGHGVCTGPKGQGEYCGSWHYGFEVSGVYTWPSGSGYEGQWQNGKRHGLGVETRGRWRYRGEWTQGFKGRYGVRQSLSSGAKYEGTWANGLQDGYGSETYADGGTYQGQWLRGTRQGYGVRSSAPFGLAAHSRASNPAVTTPKPATGPSIRTSHTSLDSAHTVDPASDRDRKIDDCRGGFVLKARSDDAPQRRRSLAEKSSNFKKSILQGFRIKKQHSTGDIDKRTATSGSSLRSSGSNMSSASSESGQSGLTEAHTDSNASFVSQEDTTDQSVVESYMGEWKNDRRCGFGIAERSDGLKYEGEWYNNKKYGYGVTTLKDGTREEGKYKNNILVTSGKKKHLFLLRSAKFRERVESAVAAATRASQTALQKADIAISRTATARGKAEQADGAAVQARDNAEVARSISKRYAPELYSPVTLGEGVDHAKLRVSGAATPQRRRSYFQAPRAQELTAPQLDADQHHLLNALSKAQQQLQQHQQLQQLQQQQQQSQQALQNQQPLQVQQQLTQQYSTNPPLHNQQIYRNNPNSIQVASKPPLPPQSLPTSQEQHEDDMPQVPGAPEPPPRTPHGSLRGASAGGSRSTYRDPYSFQQAMNDHFDQYRRDRTPSRPPSRARASPVPRVISPQKAPDLTSFYGADCTPDSGVSESMDGDSSPTRPSSGRRSTLPNMPAVEVPQRTSSLYVNPRKKDKLLVPNESQPLKRKKSLPNIADAVVNTKEPVMSREEVAALSSQRRDELRRLHEQAERMRANPLLYVFNPDVKDWLSKQQLVMLVLFINISLAIMFFKLLT